MRVGVDGAPTEGLEVGLVCTESFQRPGRSSGGAVRGPSVVSEQAVAWERWAPARPEGATFAVPADAPFTYDGAVIGWTWEGQARRADGGRAARATVEVTP